MITDGKGIPLAVTLTGGNRNDVTQLVPLLQAVVFTIATALILLNVAVDLLYMVLDPRVRLA